MGCSATGCLAYDLYMGVELNPQMSNNFDFKLFTNGRVGMMSWLIVYVGLTLHSSLSSAIFPVAH